VPTYKNTKKCKIFYFFVIAIHPITPRIKNKWPGHCKQVKKNNKTISTAPNKNITTALVTFLLELKFFKNREIP
jgi:hypothetical protein